MLPAPKTLRPSLADVMPACLSSISGQENRLGLPRASRVVVLLVDGLGAAALKSRAGHARALMSLMSGSSVIDSGFPTTTAAALATLTTGTAPGQHGMVGYTVLDPANDRVLKQLSGWDDRIDPDAWQHGLAEPAVAVTRPSPSGPSATATAGSARPCCVAPRTSVRRR